MISMIRFISLSILAKLCFLIPALASYTINGAKLEEIIGSGPQKTLTAASGTQDDTALLWFENKEIILRWSKINLDPDELTDMKMDLGLGEIRAPIMSLTVGTYKDEGGLLGAPITCILRVQAHKFFFDQASWMFQDYASLEASEESPAIIRSLTFVKKAGGRSILLQGNVDFTKKDGNFTGSSDLPGLLIAGIEKLMITFDTTKL